MLYSKFRGASLVVALGLMFVFTGCGDDPTPGPVASTPAPLLPPTPVYPASHSPMPQVISQGGRALVAPNIVSVSFLSSTLATPVEDFLSRFASSPEWPQMTAEYGVGTLSYGGAIRFTNTVTRTITDTDIQNWLSAHITPDSQTIFVLTYPTTTTVKFNGQTSCTDFDGYHSNFIDPASGQMVVYAVVNQCVGSTANDLTATATHELVEAATDPDGNSPAYGSVSQDFAIWNTLSYGSEVGDLCQMYDDSYVIPSDLGYEIQRSWSNAAAAAGSNPCGPTDPNEIYFNSAPVMSDTVTYIDAYNGNLSTTGKGVLIPVGQSRTIEIDLFSSGATNPWDVSAFEEGHRNDLTFKFDRTTGANGDKLWLTITVNQVNPAFSAEPFWIKSTLNGVTHYWPAVVGN